jgi:hypothetical protein
MSKKQTKEIAVIDLNNYPMLLDPSDAENVIEAIQENFEGEELSSRELFPVIPNMKGESSWNGVETEDGPQSFSELSGVILYIGSNRVLFEGDYGSGSKIPLCSSPDGITGIANNVEGGGPGGECATCEESQFGPNGEKPRCQNKRPMYVLLPEVSPVLPVVFNVPSTNFKALKEYKAKISRFGNKLYDVETRFTLKPEKTQNGMSTSILQMEMLSNIKKTDKEAHKKIVAFRTILLPHMQPESIKMPDELAA